MQKILKTILGLSLILGLLLVVGCGDNSGETGDVNEPGEDEKEVSYPEKPVRIIVGFGVGGSTDAVPRLLQPYLQQQLGAPVVIENLTGAGGEIAAREVYEADPDGYTLLTVALPALVLNEVFDEAATTPYSEFTPVAMIMGNETDGIISAKNSGIETIEDLAELGKERPINVATVPGITNATVPLALVADVLDDVTFQMIPYPSGTEAFLATIGGQTDITSTSTITLRPKLQDDEFNLITYVAPERMKGFEDYPVLCETYEGYHSTTKTGLFAPPGTPQEIVDIIAEAVRKAMEDPDYLASIEGKYSIDFQGPEGTAESMQAAYDFADRYEEQLLKVSVRE